MKPVLANNRSSESLVVLGRWTRPERGRGMNIKKKKRCASVCNCRQVCRHHPGLIPGEMVGHSHGLFPRNRHATSARQCGARAKGALPRTYSVSAAAPQQARRRCCSSARCRRAAAAARGALPARARAAALAFFFFLSSSPLLSFFFSFSFRGAAGSGV